MRFWLIHGLAAVAADLLVEIARVEDELLGADRVVLVVGKGALGSISDRGPVGSPVEDPKKIALRDVPLLREVGHAACAPVAAFDGPVPYKPDHDSARIFRAPWQIREERRR